MSNDKRSGEEKEINSYEDPIGLSAKNLNFGLWIASHHRLIWKTIIIILSIVAASFILYSSISYVYYFVIGREQDKALATSAEINFDTFREQGKISDLQVLKKEASRNNGFSDFLVRLRNPNDKSYALLDYCFHYQENSVCDKTFILPGQEKDVLSLKNKDDQGSLEFSWEITNITWQKIDNKEIADWSKFSSDRLKFDITDVKISTYGNNKYLEFTITNKSDFSYYQVPLNIKALAFDNSWVLNRYIVNNLESQKQQDVRILWLSNAQLSSNIDVAVDLDIMNQENYKPYISR